MLTSFLGWVFRTVATAAEAELNDDSVLREQLLEAEMRREMGEISDDEFREIESDLLARIREIRDRREGGGPLTMGGATPIETGEDERFQIEASVMGDFHEPSEAPHTTVIETAPGYREEIAVLEGDADLAAVQPRIEAASKRRGPRPKPATRAKAARPRRNPGRPS